MIVLMEVEGRTFRIRRRLDNMQQSHIRDVIDVYFNFKDDD